MKAPHDTGITAERIVALLRPVLGEAAVIEAINESSQHHGHAGAGADTHWRVRARGDAFAGKAPVARHRLVYDALLPLFAEGLHALAIDAKVA